MLINVLASQFISFNTVLIIVRILVQKQYAIIQIINYNENRRGRQKVTHKLLPCNQILKFIDML